MKSVLKMLCLLAPTSLFASEDIADQYPGSMLYAKPVEFIPGVFSATGATAPPTYDNAGHNNNLSFIIRGMPCWAIHIGLAKALRSLPMLMLPQNSRSAVFVVWRLCSG